ncbi:MAG: class I SAM-dependent methyltransferase [Candidatus Eisenbacteria bacterium]|uniref:Class I SAM-dependent methyltransferase n=1 Tax=Eiseniibacteriota bacterium TaxID=2212470 RepID=A0A849SQN8_UNCEI|nr:class I SAM-dependent methyltransferase [Candidatus Eisenbacteria bacterium]
MTDRQPVRSWAAWDRDWVSHPDIEDSLDAPTLANHIDRLKFEFLGADLPASGRAIEIGCGSARLLARMGRAAPLELVALDPAPNALAIVRRTAAIAGLRMERVRGDALSLPFPDASFDLVLSGGLLEHFPEPEAVVAEMVRILRPGGTFYADVVPRKLSMFRVRDAGRMLRTEWLMPGVYESSHGPRRYARALERLGCSKPRVRSAGVYPPRTGPALARFVAGLDGTPVADLFGWYFMIAARREPARGRGTT